MNIDNLIKKMDIYTKCFITIVEDHDVLCDLYYELDNRFFIEDKLTKIIFNEENKDFNVIINLMSEDKINFDDVISYFKLRKEEQNEA